MITTAIGKAGACFVMVGGAAVGRRMFSSGPVQRWLRKPSKAEERAYDEETRRCKRFDEWVRQRERKDEK